MKYPVALTRTEEGFSVSCPGLPGCWSQGNTEEEALSNIQEAIAEYLAVARQIAGERDLREVEVPVWAVGKISGVPHLRAVKALDKVGFGIARQGKHVVMTDGVRIVTIPRHDPVDAFTMGGIVRDAGLTEERFREVGIAEGFLNARLGASAGQFSGIQVCSDWAFIRWRLSAQVDSSLPSPTGQFAELQEYSETS